MMPVSHLLRFARLGSKAYRAGLPAFENPGLIWSKGVGRECDFAGPRAYQLAPTESAQSESFFREHYEDAHGLVWVRLSSLARDRVSIDLDTFVAVILPTIRRPFILITTDGDASAPSDIPEGTVQALLDNPFLLFWYTQNCDAKADRVRPFPIGLDLHTPRPWTTPARLVKTLERIAARSLPAAARPPRILCDLNLSLVTRERYDMVKLLRVCPHVDFVKRRMRQAAIWRRYAVYPLALSAPGNGLDCHRTWELLYLGCIVVTARSALDPLYEGLPVVILDDWTEVLDPEAPARWVGAMAHLTDRAEIWRKLSLRERLAPLRQALEPGAGQA